VLFSPKYENGEWKSRTNREELEELSKGKKYSKMDKGAKDKVAGSAGENGGGEDVKKDLHSRTGRDEEGDPGKNGEKK
jgi:hypothetical protein